MRRGVLAERGKAGPRGRFAASVGVRASLAALPLAIALTFASTALGQAVRDQPRAAGHGFDLWTIDRLPELPGPAGGPEGRPIPANQELIPELVRVFLPQAWCGDERSTDDLAHEVANGSHRFHGIYAYPADALSRFRALAGLLQADAFQASALLELAYGRGIRLDMGTSCGAQYLDISSVRLPLTTAQLQGVSGSPELLSTAVEQGVQAAGFDLLGENDNSAVAAARTKNYMLWLDGPAPAGFCGLAPVFRDERREPGRNWNDFGGKLAIVFRKGDGFCASNALRHEVGHTLGALQPSAPSAFDGAHCNDAYEDTMCYSIAPPVGNGEFNALYFDYGNNDYWDPKDAALPRWTVNLSRFICPDVSCNAPGGTSPGQLRDGDHDQVPDDIDNCRDVPNSTQADADLDRIGDACEGSQDHPRPLEPNEPIVKVRASRAGRRLWRLTIRVGGRGKARVSARCRRGRRLRTVYQRRVRAPRTLRLRVRCNSRPRVSYRRV